MHVRLRAFIAIIVAMVLLLGIITAGRTRAQWPEWPLQPPRTTMFLPFLAVPELPPTPTPMPDPCAPGLVDAEFGIDLIYGPFRMYAYRWGAWPVVIAYFRDEPTAQAFAAEARADPDLGAYVWHVDRSRIFGYLPGTPPEIFTQCAPPGPAALPQAGEQVVLVERIRGLVLARP